MRVCAENESGLKSNAEAMGCIYTAVGERSQRVEGLPKGGLDIWEVRMPA